MDLLQSARWPGQYFNLAGARTLRSLLLFGSLIELRRRITPPEQIAPFAADGLDVDFLVAVFGDEIRRRLEDVRVERARKSLVARNHHQQDALFRPREQQWMPYLACLRINDLRAALERFEHAGQHRRIGAGRNSPLLRAAQLGRRNHLHGFGDLPRVPHAADATP